MGHVVAIGGVVEGLPLTLDLIGGLGYLVHSVLETSALDFLGVWAFLVDLV